MLASERTGTMAKNEEVHLHNCKCIGYAKQQETLRKEFLNSPSITQGEGSEVAATPA